MNNIKIIQSVIFILLISSATYAQSAKKLRKEGYKYEKNGFFEKASDSYCRAIKKKPKDVKSQEGLKRSGSKIMYLRTKSIVENFDNERYMGVVQVYNSCEEYQEKFQNIDIKIDIPDLSTIKYEESKNFLAEKFYLDAQKKFQAGDYVSAINIFNQSLNYKSGYKDVNMLINQAKEAQDIIDAEKHYNYGLNNFKNKNFRIAYNDFLNCLSYKSTYKDAKELKKESLEKGTIRVGLIEFSDRTNLRASSQLYSNVSSSMHKDKSVFVKLIDNIDSQGITNSSNAIRFGKSEGFDFVVMGQIVDVDKTGGALKSQEIKAYSLYYIKDSEGKQQPRGRPTTFKVYEGSTNVKIEANYNIFSIKTGSILKSGTIADSDSDKVKYASYRNDPKNLCLTDPGKNGGSFLGSLLTGITKVDQSVFKARKKLKNEMDMKQGILQGIGNQMSLEILRYIDH